MLSSRVYVELNPRPLASHLRLGPISFPFSQPSNLEMRILDPGCICGTFQLASDVQTPSNLCAFALFARRIFPFRTVSPSPTPRPHKSFSRNTYGVPRKYCKQTTCDKTNSFSCNTYKKPGVGYPHGSSPQLLWHSHSWVCSSTSYQTRPHRQW
jgi:hypothetical protein